MHGFIPLREGNKAMHFYEYTNFAWYNTSWFTQSFDCKRKPHNTFPVVSCKDETAPAKKLKSGKTNEECKRGPHGSIFISCAHEKV